MSYSRQTWPWSLGRTPWPLVTLRLERESDVVRRGAGHAVVVVAIAFGGASRLVGGWDWAETSDPRVTVSAAASAAVDPRREYAAISDLPAPGCGERRAKTRAGV